MTIEKQYDGSFFLLKRHFFVHDQRYCLVDITSLTLRIGHDL